MSTEVSELSDGDVTRVAMRIALSAFSQLQNESEQLEDAEFLKKYIQMCPYMSPDSPAIHAALKGLEEYSSNGMVMQQERVSSSVNLTTMNAKICPVKTISIPAVLKKPTKITSVIAFVFVFLRTILLDMPLALVFAIYLGLVWTHRLNDLYFQKQINNLEWTDQRAYHETTYYNRVCDAFDMTTRTPSDLYVSEDTTPKEAYAHQLKHGVTVFPNILSERTATDLRNFVVSKNRNLTQGEVIYVIANKNRYSFGLGTEEPSVVNAVKELATHERLKPALEKILGPNPALIEMTAITAAYGAINQYWHDDVVSRASALQFGRAFGPSYSVFIQLQNTTTEMGATSACPGTHMCAHGPMDKFCDSHGFQVVNKDKVWRLGDAMLMNMNMWHRGAGHVDPDAPDRVMMIMTFVPKPRSRVESRQLSQGITFSLRWDMWGHTLSDLAKADTAMTQPWATLRALGLYKAKDADWGIDFVTGSTHRIANEDHGYRRDQLEELIESGGFKEIPKFLHGEISEDEGWHEYILYTLINCENFAKSVHLGVIAVYVVIQSILLLFSLILSNNKHSSCGRFFWAMVRLGVSHTLVYGLYKAANNHVDNTQWAKDLNAGRLYTAPFGLEDNEFQGPTTLPTRDDILIDTRYKSDYLAMYTDYVSSGHPGNQKWNGVLDVMSPIYASYSDDIFRNAVAEYTISAMLAESRRFLYQSPESHWVWMSKEDTMKEVKRQLKINSNRILNAVVSKIDHLASECKYGYLRDTSMAQIDAKVFLDDLKAQILSKVKSKPTTAVVRKGDPDVIGGVRPFPRLFQLVKPVCNSRFSRREVILHPGKQPKEPWTGAWIKAGDIVEGRYKESKTSFKWYLGTVTKVASQGLISISFHDETVDNLKATSVRRYYPLDVGEDLEYLYSDFYTATTVLSANTDGTYNIYLPEYDRTIRQVHKGMLRRSN